jgi:hypothetical protein
MKLLNKASINISISWVFMFIVGTFFVFLAYSFIADYRAIEEEKLQIELSQGLRSIFNNVARTSGIEENSIYPLRGIFRNSQIEIICEEGSNILKINNQLDANNDFIKTNPIFMSYIKQGKIDETYLLVENYRIPFKTSSLLAIVSIRNIVIFDENSNIAQRFLEKVQSSENYINLSFYFEDLSTYSADNFNDEFGKASVNSVTFVKDKEQNINVNLGEIDSSITKKYIIEIEEKQYQEADNKRYYGNLNFIDQNNQESEFSYVDYDSSMALLIMAFFADPNNFKCSYEILLEKNLFAYDFYLEKARVLEEESMNNYICSSSIGDLESQRFRYIEIIESLEDVQSKLNEAKNEGKINKDESLLDSIKVLNDRSDFATSYNCQHVY